MTYNNIAINSNFPWQNITIVLSGVVYVLTFRYNTRSSRWEMDIADGSNNVILSGIIMLINQDLTYQYKTAISNLPVGTFFIIDNTNKDIQPTLNSWGITNTLTYADPTDS